MALIETTDNIFNTVGSQRIYLSESLNNWNDPVDFLYCDQLNLVAAPSIDTAQFNYSYGALSQHFENGPGGVYPPLDFKRKYVKLQLLNPDQSVLLTWYGIFISDERQIDGSLVTFFDGQETLTPKGIQKPTAYGLLYLLENTIIDHAEVEKRAEDPLVSPSTDTMTIGRGITFNGVDGTTHAQRGNRSAMVKGGYNGYVFSDLPFGSSLWNAEDAIKYLLHFHTPKSFSDLEVAEMKLVGTTDVLTWYDKTVDTDRRNVKEVIDELVDRRRAAGYWVTGMEADSGFEIHLKAFTFADQPIDLGDGKVIPTNPDKVELNFEKAIDGDDITLTNNFTQLVSDVIVYGAPIVVVCTLKTGDQGLVQGWTDSEVTNYLAGDSAADDYSSLDISNQEKRNQRARQREVFKDVFARFVLSGTFDGKMDHLEESEDEHYILPDLDSLLDLDTFDTTKAFQTTYENGDGVDPPSCWWRGKRFLSELPLRDDTSILAQVDSYQKPFVVFEIEADADPEKRVYEFGHKLAANADNENAEQSRSWSVGLEMLDTEPGFRMIVQNGPQHFLAKNSWVDAAATNQAIDPDSAEGFKTGALDWDDAEKEFPTLWTVALESDDRISATWESQQAFEDRVNNPNLDQFYDRRKVIHVEDARLVLIAPATVTDLTSSGKLEIDTKGSIYEDDRERLQRIATAAGVWYGTERQALEMSFKQLNTLGLAIGNLVTSIGTNYGRSNVNSVITGMRFDFLSVKTTIETSFVELDVTNESFS